MTFKELNLIEPILKALDKQGYESPTPIQAQAIPYVTAGNDLLAVAQTGTGKTAAFCLPIIQRLITIREAEEKPRHKLSCLILTPTRELAIQIGENIAAYARYTKLRHTVIFGGVKQGRQVQIMDRGVDILVATPGRLLDLMNQGHINLDDIGIFVLDEADRMLDMGFIHDVKRIIRVLPKNRQSLFFSATMPDDASGLANEILNDPKTVAVTPVSSTAETIEQWVFFVDRGNKVNLLSYILEDDRIETALVFSRTKHGANRIVKELNKIGIRSDAIHGNKSQNARQDALSKFKDRKIRVLVATDIAARGIDVDSLSHVINYDLPNIPETYVHRIGRTGRAGSSGVALSLCQADEVPYLRDINALIGGFVEVVEDHPWPMVEKIAAPAPKRKKFGSSGPKRSNGGSRGGGGSSSRGGARTSSGGGGQRNSGGNRGGSSTSRPKSGGGRGRSSAKVG